VATYFAFGQLERERVELGGGVVEIAKLDGALHPPFSVVTQWIADSAGAVAAFYGGLPMPRANVLIAPVPARSGVVFGKVLPESEPAIALLVGEDTTQGELYDDWILIHELFHLGTPSFYGEGKWFDEGLATYFEPIIRIRAGMYTEQQFWDDLEKWLPRGLPAFTELGLERATEFGGIYWGGALACLVADVTARRRNPKLGLEQAFLALHRAGARANQVWELREVIGAIDAALGAPTLAPIARAHAERGSPFDLPGLLNDLGVSRTADGSLRFDDTAPLAPVRRAITRKP
jgi:hypothetical protein